MTVYLGTFGKVELERQFGGSELNSVINTSDVNASAKRFSFDFEHGQLLTGDQVEILSTDGSALDFISGYSETGVKKFIYVDDLGGVFTTPLLMLLMVDRQMRLRLPLLAMTFRLRFLLRTRPSVY